MFFDPHSPTLAELLVMDQGNSAYLHHLYRHLLGREPDADGLDAYLARLPKTGRLFILSVILCSDESEAYLGASDVQLPSSALLTMRIQPLLSMGWLGKLLLAPLISLTRLWEWSKHDSLAMESRCLRAEAQLDWQSSQIGDIFTDIDHQLSLLEMLQTKQHSSSAAVQQLRGRVKRIIQHGLLTATGEPEPSYNEFNQHGEQQQLLLEALETRWEGRP